MTRDPRPIARLAWLALVSCLTMAGTAHAFEFDEHCQVSNDALRIATSYAERTSSKSQYPLTAEEIAGLRGRTLGCGREGPTSYGEWVALVDNATSPSDFYAGPRESLSSDPVLKGLINDKALRQLRRNFVMGLFAAHLNVDHFQDRGLFAFVSWHREAVALAAGGNLWSALLVNAFGDHLLQDSFAPGHLRTPRRELHDAAAVAMHDYYNRYGAEYQITAPQELAELVSVEERRAAPDLFAGVNGSLAEYLRAHSRILMKGDGRLHESCDQQIVMALTVARSIADILESYQGRVSVNSFSTFTWKGYHREPSKTGTLFTPRAGTRFGEFESRAAPGPLRLNPAFALNLGAESFFGAPIGSRWNVGPEIMIGGSPGRAWVDDVLTPPQFGLLAGYTYSHAQDLTSHAATMRVVVPMTRLDLQVSAIGKHTWYRSDEANQAKWGFGGRFEMGFGMVFVGVGVERQYLFVGGRLRPRTATTVNLSLVGRGTWLGF